MATLTIHDRRDSALAFDLRDILRVLAPLSLKAAWTIRNPDGSDFEATGEGGSRLEALASASAQIGGGELIAIADNTAQVIWGDFIGALPGDLDGKWITIRAVDSSFYEVETMDQACIERITSRFRDVRIARDRS